MSKTLLFTNLASIVIVTCFCGNHESKYFKVTISKRIEIKFRKVTVNSNIECCTECAREQQCVSVSVNPALGTCWLHETRLEDHHKDDISNNVLWRVYTKSCGVGWKFYKQSCYLGISGRKEWQRGKLECQGHSAHLPKIEDQATQEFNIANFANREPYIWLGLNDIDSEETFTWMSDGSAPTFTSWDIFEPETRSSLENCVGLRTSRDKWYAAKCTDKLKIVCEKHV